MHSVAISRVIEQELHKNAAVITKVSETASKEFAIESALDKMQGAWATVKLNTEEYRETGPPPSSERIHRRNCLSLSKRSKARLSSFGSRFQVVVDASIFLPNNG